MNETWIGPEWWPSPPPSAGGWVDMEEGEEPDDVPGFMEERRGGKGLLVQVIAQG